MNQVLLTPEEVAALLQGLDRAETGGGAQRELGPALRSGPCWGCPRNSGDELPGPGSRSRGRKPGEGEPA